MDQLSQEEKDEIIEILKERGAIQSCPRCGHGNFTILDGYMTHSLQSKLEGQVIGGPAIPTVAVICNNCGFVSEHALGVLGLLEDEKVESDDE